MCTKIGFISSVFLMIGQVLLAGEPKVVKLTPPVFNQTTISQEITCTRPMREGRFNISTETFKGKEGSKLIVNCNGHGGSGWTTLFGSVKKAIELFQEQNPDKSIPIRVIGSGCMGLTSAIELSNLGYTVAGITTKELYDIPSWRAAGYFALVSVKTSPEEQENLNLIGVNTFLVYQQIDRGLHPYITKEAVRMLPVYCDMEIGTKATDCGVEDLVSRGLLPPPEEVTLDFGNGVLHPEYAKYMTYFMNTTVLMRQTTAEVKRLGIPIEMREVKSYDEVKEAIVFNCAGLGARELNQDDKMIPVRGHLIMLKENAGTEHMNYMIYTRVLQGGKDEYIYMFPKTLSVTPDNIKGTPCIGVVGGTFIPNVDKLTPEEQEKLDKEEFRKMRDRASLFFTGKPFEDKLK